MLNVLRYRLISILPTVRSQIVLQKFPIRCRIVSLKGGKSHRGPEVAREETFLRKGRVRHLYQRFFERGIPGNLLVFKQRMHTPKGVKKHRVIIQFLGGGGHLGSGKSNLGRSIDSFWG